MIFKHQLNDVEKQNYCDYILSTNIFKDYEIDYYIGNTEKKPHNIDNKFWKQAFLNVNKKLWLASDNNKTRAKLITFAKTL